MNYTHATFDLKEPTFDGFTKGNGFGLDPFNFTTSFEKKANFGNDVESENY